MPKASDLQTKRDYVARTLKDKLEALEPERREAVEAEADRLHAEYLHLESQKRSAHDSVVIFTCATNPSNRDEP